MTLRQTVLNGEHRALNARMVDFGGWEMPLHYGSQIAEHERVRRAAGMFDVSHMLAVDVGGDDARSFLLRLLANNVDRLQADGAALYSCMLDERAGVLDDLIAYRLGEGRYRLVVNAATADKDLAWLHARAADFAADVRIAPRRDLAIIAVQGPQARDKVWSAIAGAQALSQDLAPFHAAQGERLFVARTGYTGEDGFELMLPGEAAPAAWQALLRAGVAPAGLGARDTLRLEAGMKLYGQDMDESVTPLECGLGWTVDLAEGRSFVGERALRGAPARFAALGLVLLDRGVLRPHQEVLTPLGAGFTTSGSFSPTLQVSIAFARLPPGMQEGAQVQVKVRDKWLQARTVKSAFVRRGRSLLAGHPAVAATATREPGVPQ
jgi:aminomethyltransferase